MDIKDTVMEVSPREDSSFTLSFSYLETRPKADSDLGCLGSDLEQLLIAFTRREDSSLDLSESMMTLGESEVSVAREHREDSRIVPGKYVRPFGRKPKFNGKTVGWKRDLEVELPEELCMETICETPSEELIARYPKPSIAKWDSGTKRGYEDIYYYCDL